MDMDIKLSLSPAITAILQNTPFENVKEPQFHQCFKQYSKLCSSSLIAVICSKRRKKTKKKSFTAQRYSAPQIIRLVLFH